MKTILTSILILLLLSSDVLAQPSTRFPESIYTQHEGQTYRSFDLEGFRSLLELDSDLVYTLQEVNALERQLGASTALSENLGEQLRLTTLNLNLVIKDRQRLTNLYFDTSKELRDLQNKPNYLGILGWTTSVVTIGISIGLITAFITRK